MADYLASQILADFLATIEKKFGGETCYLLFPLRKLQKDKSSAPETSNESLASFHQDTLSSVSESFNSLRQEDKIENFATVRFFIIGLHLLYIFPRQEGKIENLERFEANV